MSFPKSEPGLFSDEQGEMRLTGQQTDVAIEGDGYFMVENQNGVLGMSRRGDLQFQVTEHWLTALARPC